MTAAEVIDVANVLAHLRRDHGIDPDPAFGPLRGSDFRFIGECVANDWNTFGTAREVAARVAARGET